MTDAVVPNLPLPRFTLTEKEEIFRANRSRLERDLARLDFSFHSRPLKVDLQLSNFCNMSCAMCYAGDNPPLEKMSPLVIRKVATEILPTASVLVPFIGSEPLVLTWDTARSLAREFLLELEIDTNVQYLDEQRFFEIEPFVSTIVFSIDTHIPEIYDKIRLRANREKVFRNLKLAARLCREHGIEVIVNSVLLTLNGPHLHETVAFMAAEGVPTVRVVPYLPVMEHRRDLDPTLNFTPDQILGIKEKCISEAKRNAIRLLWDVGGYEAFDFRPEKSGRHGKHADGLWMTRFRRYLPGFCTQSVYRVSVHANGDTYPCCVAGGDALILGNLERSDFPTIWNGPASRDLRRAMLTSDVPKFCKHCGFHTKRVSPAADLPFVKRLVDRVGPVPPQPNLRILGPEYLARRRRPLTIRWEPPPQAVDRYVIALAIGGEGEHLEVFSLPPNRNKFRIPWQFWETMKANYAYWWTVWGINESNPALSIRPPEMRCLIRHESIRRLRESTLDY